MIKIRSAGLTDTGLIRQINQDKLLMKFPLYAVADGMGGHVGGEVAAQIATEELANYFSYAPNSEGLITAVKQANLAIWQRAYDDSELRGMGTTLTAVCILDLDTHPRLIMAHVGDSRLYLLRSGQLIRVSEDHTLVEELVKKGKLKPLEALTDKRRHTLTRAIGIEVTVTVDQAEVQLKTGDRIIICSDGLSNEVRDEEICAIVENASDPETAAEDLVRLAKAHGGRDNITALVIFVEEDDQLNSKNVIEESSDQAKLIGISSMGGEIPSVAATFEVNEELDEHSVLSDVNDSDYLSETPEELEATELPPVVKASTGGEVKKVYEIELTPSKYVGPRMFTFRTLLVTALIAMLLGSGYYVTNLFIGNSYFLGVYDNRIAIFQGRPGATELFKPKVIYQSGLSFNQLLPSQKQALQRGIIESSEQNAKRDLETLEKSVGSYSGSVLGSGGNSGTNSGAMGSPNITSYLENLSPRTIVEKG